jgi:proprotein convertase subtilisin/kexin type 2
MEHPARILSLAMLSVLALSGCGSGGGGAVTSVQSPIPSGLSATARDGSDTIKWTAIRGVTSYNIYWSTVTGVNKSNGTKIALASDPQTHTGLANGTTYYYVVTSVISGVESAESSEVSATPVAAPTVADPLYADQWHLNNTGQNGADGTPGKISEDINAEPAWASSKGSGIRIAIVDDGLEIGHEDLAANIAPTGLSYNYVTGSSDPSYDPTDMTSGHGTEVAGIAAARDWNGLGGRGTAPHANLVGYNLLQKDITSNEADAMTRGSSDKLLTSDKWVYVSSNSWGAPDGYGTLDASTLPWRNAVDTGIANGRGGLGTIYTWAAGNGGNGSGPPIDNSNYDGQANFRGVIAVTSVNDQGKQSSYAEPGANIWISAPGGEYCQTHTITTTDRTGTAGDNSYNNALYNLTSYDYTNTNNYTKCMNGTSAATPQVAGVAALMLQANPNLSWRDVRLILAQSARLNDPTDSGWTAYGVTVPPYHFNHKYGFGVVDAGAAVALASPLTWTNVGPQLSYATALVSPNLAIKDYPGAAVSNTIIVAGSGISHIEFIEITFSAANHKRSGDLAITLTSPAVTVSQLSETHACNPCTPYNNWIFGSARHLGEAADGNWTLTVKDGKAGNTGTFQSWGLKFYGR